MANPIPRRRQSSHNFHLLCGLLLSLILVQSPQVSCREYKVGDLDAWGIPSADNGQVYEKWSKYHTFNIGDTLLFLYPPSEDSVIQVTEQSYNTCNLKDPILTMNDGNSLFNITSLGTFFFTSSVSGRCEKKQKLRISVGNVSSSTYAPGPSALSDISPSYPTVFGSIPQGSSSSSFSISLTVQSFPVSSAVAIGFATFATVRGVF
ncbi:early nodulin-like protein 1 [Punica granatum]|uniref:Early nodulin-like protein 1 n=2 Tax=Punica granatum TaxID=22663 RepID=A0A6P8D110_PUNGR|nr:early nodulin-like protein 1 [Punica granatum]PKI51710.1 hypothetical protein CRG98_027873 [Punica granatum]